jgi:hypothetical protein
MLLDRVRGRWFAAAVEHADGWRGCLNRCLVVVLLAGIGGLSALASASPSDSVGLPGIYDHADYDDVAVLLTEHSKPREFSARGGQGCAPFPRACLVSLCPSSPRRFTPRLSPSLSA